LVLDRRRYGRSPAASGEDFLKLRALMTTLLRQDARDLAHSMVQKMAPCTQREQLVELLGGDFAEAHSRAEVAWIWHHEANRRMREGTLDETEDCFRRAIAANNRGPRGNE
jgi:hypothetical protein